MTYLSKKALVNLIRKSSESLLKENEINLPSIEGEVSSIRDGIIYKGRWYASVDDAHKQTKDSRKTIRRNLR